MFRKIDTFLLCLIVTIIIATVFPCTGNGVKFFQDLAVFVIGLMFFFQGARLSRRAIIEGMINWRIHLAILTCTFVVFPVIGTGLHALFPRVLSTDTWTGLLFLCCLPSTVQSSIAFTSIGQGNVAAAICSATMSNILGIFITPILTGLVVHHSAATQGGVTSIMLQLLLPFMLGQMAQPWIGPWVHRYRQLVSLSDRGSILIVVYTAFSEAVTQGLWHRVPPLQIGYILLADSLLLFLVLVLTTFGSRLLGFSRRDEVAIVFCGSKKTLASGVPMANVLFAGPMVGIIVLPLMIYHQLQLFVCATLARRYARHAQDAKARDIAHQT
ncbi:bile acid:sodium symporter family protein [Novacetimonas pomaceti]|uniref:Bile acid:sodium symporter n=1 Tax=Novacetimonas pomaceti TaxID=2021998 RepID=A0A318Q807_9PROT|nr:bile acid:sodium symporter family protein [Novacetimonas pomaceti]PYD47978.1 bile acid:sodium symporter [Novacetimonas pomaceti]PYD75786.1 bile acid:sodium symporter [Novacetimonas pomaceti]